MQLAISIKDHIPQAWCTQKSLLCPWNWPVYNVCRRDSKRRALFSKLKTNNEAAKSNAPIKSKGQQLLQSFFRWKHNQNFLRTSFSGCTENTGSTGYMCLYTCTNTHICTPILSVDLSAYVHIYTYIQVYYFKSSFTLFTLNTYFLFPSSFTNIACK